jgi:hypothetical protein
MNSQAAAHTTDQFANPGAELLRWTVGMLVVLMATAAVLVAWRRIAGALAVPLEVPLLLATGFLSAVVAVASREACARRRSRLDLALWIAPTPALLLLGVALSLPGTSTAGLIVFWGLLVVEETWSWRRAPWRGQVRAAREHPPQSEPELAPVQREEPEHRQAVVDECPPEEVTQQLTRGRGADGSEHITGWLRAPFAAGQRTAVVHVSFCPPLNKIPELKVHQADGPKARIKTAQLLPHGARLDLKLSQSAEQSASVLLQFSAHSPGEK